MIKHDKKNKIAILTGGLIILMAVLIATYIADKTFGSKLMLYAAEVLVIGSVGAKLLFVMEKKKEWLNEKRCEVHATTVIKHLISFFCTFLTVFMIYHLGYMDYSLIIVCGIMAGILVGIAEFFTSKRGMDDCKAKTYDDDWWKESQTDGYK